MVASSRATASRSSLGRRTPRRALVKRSAAPRVCGRETGATVCCWVTILRRLIAKKSPVSPTRLQQYRQYYGNNEECSNQRNHEGEAPGTRAVAIGSRFGLGSDGGGRSNRDCTRFGHPCARCGRPVHPVPGRFGCFHILLQRRDGV